MANDPIEVDDPRLHFVPFEEASKLLPGLVELSLNDWWLVHPEKGLVYWKLRNDIFPQRNRNEVTARTLAALLYGSWVEVRQIPVVCLRINPADYCG